MHVWRVLSLVSPLGDHLSARLFRDVARVLAGSVLQGGIRLVAAAVVAREGGPETQGGFALAQSCVVTGAVVLGLGLDYANMYFAGMKSERASAIAAHSLLVAGGAALAGALWAATFVHFVPQSVAGEVSHLLGVTLLAAATGVLALQQSTQAMALGLNRTLSVGLAGSVGALAWLVLAAPSARAGGTALLVAWMTASLIPSAWHLSSVARTAGIRADSTLLREQLAYGLRTVPAALFRSFNLRLTLFLTGAFLPLADVGVYGFVVTLAESVLVLPIALGQVTLVVVAGGNYDPRRSRLPYFAAAAVPLLIGVACAIAGARGLELIAGARYASGAPALTVLLGAAALHGIGMIRLHQLMGAGRPMVASSAQGVALLATAAGGFLLVPRWGMMGAAVTTLLTYTVFAAFLLRMPHPEPVRG